MYGEGVGNWVWAAVQPLLAVFAVYPVAGAVCDPGFHRREVRSRGYVFTGYPKLPPRQLGNPPNLR